MAQKSKPTVRTNDITDSVVKGVKKFFGTKSSNKPSLTGVPSCFGGYRSSQNDAENCCEDCVKDETCFRKFEEKQEESSVHRNRPKFKSVPVVQHDPEEEFLKTFKRLTSQHRAWDIWKDFVVMFACALSNVVDTIHYDEREALYMKTIKNYNKQEQYLFAELTAKTVTALGLNPEQDFLGKIFMRLELGNNASGQFFTPYPLCQFMAAITTGDVIPQVEKDGYITIHDPCCGAGATLIAGIHEARKQLEKAKLNFQSHIFVTGQDIDSTVALMCYIQISILGVAGYIKIGNALTEPIISGDSLENYWVTPMSFSGIWSARITKGEKHV